MSTIYEFHEFAEALRERYQEVRRAAPAILHPAAGDSSPAAADSLCRASRLFEATLHDLGAAAEELQEQNDALFEARTELEAQGRFYRELFDLAPAACLVTTRAGRITHANHAATYLLGHPLNALVGKLMVQFVVPEERSAFRSALVRVHDAPSVEEFPIRLACRGAPAVDCRVRVSGRREGHHVRSLQWMVTEDGSSDDDLL
jgi:PAS domain-containing protein